MLLTIHEATHRGHRALLKPMWSPANIIDMMNDDLDIPDHITAILYVGQQSAGEGLTEEEAQVCIDHFSPYCYKPYILQCLINSTV